MPLDLARLQTVIEAIVEQRLDAMEEAGRAGDVVDMVQEFAFAVPFDVICELLGLPVEDRARFLELGVARFDLTEGGAGAFGAAAHTREFLINAVRLQRADPGDGLIGALLKEYGDELDDVTLGGIADGVFLGGYETSASMLALGAYLIASTPQAGVMLRSGDAEQVNRVIEELLRHLCVVQLAFLRFAKTDVVVGGVEIKAGDAVGVSLMAANRDPALGERRQHRRGLAGGDGQRHLVLVRVLDPGDAGAHLLLHLGGEAQLHAAATRLYRECMALDPTHPEAALAYKQALAVAGREGWKVDPACSYAAGYMERHPEFSSLRAF